MLASLIAILPRAVRDDALLRSAGFRRFWLSSVLNGFGAQVSLFAIPLCAALLLNASPGQMGTLAALELLPFALFSMPAGVLLDRSRKLPILLVSRLTAALALSSIALAAWSGVLSIGWMYCVAFTVGATHAFGGSAEQVFLTAVIGRERGVEAQTWLAATDSAARLLGPGIAGLLVQLLSAPFALLATACASLAAILNMRRLQAEDPLPAPSRRHPLHDMWEGILYIRRHPVLFPVACSVAAWQVLFNACLATSILFATRVLGLSPGMLGIVQAGGGAGMLAGAMLLKPLVRRHGTGPAMLAGLAASTASFVLTAALPARLFGSAQASQAGYAVLLFLLDCGVVLFMLPYVALRQRHTPDAYLGRVNSTMRFLTVAAGAIGAFCAGLLGERYGIRAVQLCVGVASLGLCAAIWTASPLPRLKE